MTARDIVIIGGGFSGAALAYHLLRRGGASIVLIERDASLGRGIAYGVESEVFRLNVPAARMSLDPGRANDFVEWAGAAPNEFLPRARYGAYVEARLAEAMQAQPDRLRILRGEAVAIDDAGVVLADGAHVPAQAIVLATGLRRGTPPAWQGLDSLIGESRAVDSRIIDAWDERSLARVPNAGKILLVGSGLSALDVLAWLEARAFEGQILVVSRHGLWPRAHLAAPAPFVLGDVAAAPADLRGLVAWVRDLAERADESGGWQRSIDALRPHLPTLWRRLSLADRRRFVERVRPYWDVLRHRAPADALQLVARWQQEGLLELRAGRLEACVAQPHALEVRLCWRGGEMARMSFDCVVSCTGPELDAKADPLIASLLAKGLATPDPSGLGIVTDTDGALPNAAQRIFTLGALRRASSWESIAVPELAAQAQALAARLCVDLERR